ncbi:MAG TPA: GNAT family N-acetyltransferase [Candidatus Latescibacteria bacterium]|nr:GNAT family N-acetyltransferase [Candidatus Latescibacterota bacterium]
MEEREQVDIRTLSPQEFWAQRRRLGDIYRRAYRGLEIYAYTFPGEVHSYLRWLYRGDPEMFLVAYNGGEPVGFLSGHRYWYDRQLGEVGNIHEFVVDPEFHRRGIGRALLREAIRRFSRDHSWVMLWVGEGNKRARAFYRKMGFEEVGRAGIWIKMRKHISKESL